MSVQRFVLICFIFPSLLVDGYKILFYSPRFTHSHVTFLGHLADTLAAAGHDVVVYLPQMNENVTTSGVKLARTIETPLPFPFPLDLHSMQTSFWEQRGESPIQVFRLRNENFDVGITEVFDACGLGIFHLIGLKTTIAASASVFNDAMAVTFGAPNLPSYVPGGFQATTDKMTYIERLKNLLGNQLTILIFNLFFYNPVTQVFRRVHGDAFPDLQDLQSKASFAFVNSEEFTDFPRPITHKIVYIAGIGVGNPKPLDQNYLKELKKFADEAADGVVLVSFGSVAQSALMPPRMKQAFLDAFARFPRITFLWKYEADDGIADHHKNVIVKKWLPQLDLFGHRKLLAFVSHGGMNSVTEATHLGIPIICIPLFGDQIRNAKMVENRGVAYVLEKDNITADSFAEALQAVVYGNSYRENARRLSEMIARKPMNASQRVVKYTEFAAEFGNIPHLDPEGRHLNFVEYFLLDIIVPLFLFAITILMILYRLMLKLFVCCCCRRRSKAKSE